MPQIKSCISLSLTFALAATLGLAESTEGRVRFEAIDLNANEVISPLEMVMWRLSKFATRDLNEDGVISRNELLEAATDGARPMTWEESSDFILNLDNDGDLSVSITEVITAMERSDFFGIMDHDGSGAITRSEADGWLDVSGGPAAAAETN